jgi:hypothetical protein
VLPASLCLACKMKGVRYNKVKGERTLYSAPSELWPALLASLGLPCRSFSSYRGCFHLGQLMATCSSSRIKLHANGAAHVFTVAQFRYEFVDF